MIDFSEVEKYRNGVGYPQDYAESVNRLKAEDIRKIVAAHEYDPFGSTAEGIEAVQRYLDGCLEWNQKANA